ncbi:FAD-dependent monooxygenase [Ktedonosporobacter rubrisoli]|uniref:FAD-dependent monooxygenase n=1 Tax=Ktedonosporobacter rubrisoli TaxID=2509675 RepID=A0A4P6JTS9_KTERU|nr:NAD(P)/FAD-dependent oxidoreductase [Ktedonosporobacter rubrisoli]QBD78316.1 FAD-dependent monooxygenase [Ktedonosporobacter rubrisoli]
MNQANRKALIIGSGIAGPALALFLRRAGIEAEIYEARTSSIDYGGLFLNTACNGLGVLRILGLDEQVLSQGSPIPHMTIWSGDGKRLGDVLNGAREGVGVPSINILRSRLHQTLCEETERKGIRINFGKKLVSLESNPQGVHATFADGTTADGSFLVGCDGVHSRVRALINPAAPAPNYTGLISTGGFTQRSSFSPTPNTMHFVFGKRAFFGYHVSVSQELYWFVNFSQSSAPARGELDMIVNEEWQERMLALFREDMPLISKMIRETESTIIGYPIYDITTQPTWYQGPVVLAGDALHAISPNAGQGASLALEDALTLAKCLRDQEDYARAFATYEHLRRARVERMVRYGRSMNQSKAMSNPIQVWFRDLLMPFFLKNFARPASLDWIYSYQPDWNKPAMQAVARS